MKSTAPEAKADPEIEEASFAGKTVIVCLGNRYLRDDGIGILVAEELKSRNLGSDILVDAYQTADLSLLWQYQGASRIIIIDALRSGAPPGTISRYTITPTSGPLAPLQGLHKLQLHDMFDIASRTGLLTCPVTILGVEPKDCGIGEGLSAELATAMSEVVTAVIKELGRLGPGFRAEE